MSEAITQEVSTPSVSPVESTPNTQASSPDVSGKSTAEIAELIGQLNTGGNVPKMEEATPIQNETKPEVKQEVKPQQAQADIAIPDKFKNPDGSPNVPAMAKSYTDLEKQYGRLSNTAKENELLRQQLADIQTEIESVKANVNTQSSKETNKSYTPEELELLQNDPAKFVELAIEKKLQGRMEEERKQRMADYELHTAVNKARSELSGYKELEPEIEQLAEQEFISKSPKAIPFLYYAALGQKTEALVNSAKTKAYQEGYEKAKADMKLSVEGNGRDSTPAGLELNPETIAGKSAAEIEKLLPKSNRGTTSYLY